MIPLDNHHLLSRYLFLLPVLLLLAAACSTATLAATPTPVTPAPRILSTIPDRRELPRYGAVEFAVDLEAEYANP